MNTEQRENLKNYTSSNLVHSLIEIKNEIPKDYLSNDLVTRKSILSDANKIMHCSENMYIAEGLPVDTETGVISEKTEKRRINLNSSTCGIFVLCPICQRQRADVICRKYMPPILEQVKVTKYQYMLTFTIRDSDNFSDNFSTLSKGVREFFRMGQRRKGNKRSKGEASKIVGGLGSIEVVPGRGTGKPHVHAHYIVFTNEKLNFAVYDQEKKKEIIRHFNEVKGYKPKKSDLLPAALHPQLIENQQTGTMEKILFSPLSWDWFRATKGRGLNIKCSLLKKDVPLEKQLREVIKYATKLNGATTELVKDLLINRKKRRWLSAVGSLRNVETEDTEEQEQFLKIEYAESKAWDHEQKKYLINSPECEKYLTELVKKRDKVKDHKIACNKIRGLKSKALSALKPVVELFGLAEGKIKLTEDYINKKKQIINEIDTINKVEKYVCNHLWCKIVKINRGKNPHLRSRKVATPREKFYWDYFLKEYEKIK